MSATHKFIITRPNLETPFYFEDGTSELVSNPDDVMGLNLTESFFYHNGQPTVSKYNEAITWNEVWTRRNELRPDQKTLLESTWNSGENGYTEQSEYADHNPFSLTHTRVEVYDTFENLVTTYNNVLTNDNLNALVNQAKASNNVITEEFYNNGVLDTSITSKFAGKF